MNSLQGSMQRRSLMGKLQLKRVWVPLTWSRGIGLTPLPPLQSLVTVCAGECGRWVRRGTGPAWRCLHTARTLSASHGVVRVRSVRAWRGVAQCRERMGSGKQRNLYIPVLQ